VLYGLPPFLALKKLREKTMSLELGVNIDHVVTLRQVRYKGMLHLPNAEPDVLRAVFLAESAGADQITIHLREDRRHIQDQDVYLVREAVKTKLNLEMGLTEEIISIALDVKPHTVCLVPEHRQEVTTEGGLDVAGREALVKEATERFHAAGIKVSLFIDAESEQIAAAARVGADMIELHTGRFANTQGTERKEIVTQLIAGAQQAHALGLQVNAGHGINLGNVAELMAVPHLVELNIGHHLICRALEHGLSSAVREMKQAMAAYVPTV
jgi:pyridoxine 5-phosphate synthase